MVGISVVLILNTALKPELKAITLLYDIGYAISGLIYLYHILDHVWLAKYHTL